eukprot:3896871-Pyramimonas_sp.AAC.1
MELWEGPPMVLDMALLFSGQAQAADIAAEKGMRCGTLDKADDECQDITAVSGLMFAMFLILSLKKRGLVWMSPECSTWLVFISRSSYKRAGSGSGVVGDVYNEK